MIATNFGPQASLKFEAEIGSDGRLEIQVPSAAGERVVVFVIAETFSDLTAAAESSLDSWDNPLDAEDWNNA